MIPPLSPGDLAFNSQPCGIEEVKDHQIRPEAHSIVGENYGRHSGRTVTPAPKMNVEEKGPDPQKRWQIAPGHPVPGVFASQSAALSQESKTNALSFEQRASEQQAAQCGRLFRNFRINDKEVNSHHPTVFCRGGPHGVSIEVRFGRHSVSGISTRMSVTTIILR